MGRQARGLLRTNASYHETDAPPRSPVASTAVLTWATLDVVGDVEATPLALALLPRHREIPVRVNQGTAQVHQIVAVASANLAHRFDAPALHPSSLEVESSNVTQQPRILGSDRSDSETKFDVLLSYGLNHL